MWDILGIEPTTDLQEIKKAYSELLPKYHPEDDPEGYQRLRQAFDFARKYAKKHKDGKENKDEFYYNEEIYENDIEFNSSDDEEISIEDNVSIEYEEENTEIDMDMDYIDESNAEDAANYEENNIDKIMNQITDLYNDYFKRIDIDNWKNLFDNDILLDFEIIDNVSIILLKFLVKNYLIPREVWKYLNTIFDWESQYTMLREYFDDDTIETIFDYIDKEQFINFDVDWDIEDFNYNYYIKLRVEAYIAMRNNNLELAYSNMEKAYKLYKDDKILIRMLCEYFKRIDEANKGYHMAHKLISLDKMSREGYRYRAYFALKLKNYTRAMEDCDAIIEDNHSEELYVIKANCYIALNQLLEAKEILDDGLKRYDNDIQMYGLLMTVESLIEKEKDINKEFRKEVKKRKKQEKLHKNRNMHPIKRFIKYFVLLCFVMPFVIAAMILCLPRIEETDEPTTTQITDESQNKNLIVNRPLRGSHVKFNRLSLAYIGTITGDVNELMGYAEEEASENKISFFIFNYKEDDINYLVQFNEKEMEQYESGAEVIEYIPKDIVLNKYKVVDLINTDTEFKLDVDNTYMFDMLKE